MRLLLKSKRKFLFIVVLALLFAFCHQEKGAEQNTDSGIPPDDFIRSNFSAAELVLSLKPDSLKIVKTIYDDKGAPGYVIVEVAAKVKECYKGNISSGERILYRFLAEFEENLLENWREKDLLLVFLKEDEKNRGLRAIEFGQFELTPSLFRKVESFRKD